MTTNIKTFIESAKKGEIDFIELTEKAIEETKKINKEYNYFNAISEELARKQAKELDLKKKQKKLNGKLTGVFVSVKDCLNLEGIESRAGSKILSDYKPVFSSTAVQKMINEGAIILGKTSQDEFGFGGFNINTGVDFKIPLNPIDKERVCGGSSGGASGFTKKFSQVHIALSESTGGSIANPASFCGVLGMTPTYSRVSRNGLIDYANSLDKIGVTTKNVFENALALEIISGYDENDLTSSKQKVPVFLNEIQVKKKLRIGIPKELLENKALDEKVKDAFCEKIEEFKKKGFEIKSISMPLTEKYGISCYYLIALTESSTNLAKYCGLRYGLTKKIDLQENCKEFFSEIREQGFGKEAKRRILLGTFARMAGFRDAYYLKAMKTRTLIIEESKKAFKEVDLIANPTMPCIAPKINEITKLSPLQNYLMDLYTAPANLAGFPHISFNAGLIEQMPVGVMLTANHFEESKLYQAINSGDLIE